MILWLNGAFGVGKTTTARSIQAARPGWRLFDPEIVGSLLMAHLHDQPIGDFQDLPAWRSLVPRVAHELATHTGADLIAVQTVLVEDFWVELATGAAKLGLDVCHVFLDCAEPALRERIRADEIERRAEEWRLDHLAAYAGARPWLLRCADVVIDTTAMTPDLVAARVLAELP
jgi:AAA domain